LEVLGLFAKHWTPGEVKTRIAATTGPDLAARLAHWLLESATEEFHAIGDQRWLLYSPPEKRALFTELPQIGQWSLFPQAPGDLGVRLQEFFRAAFAAGAKRVVAIGADCPAMSAATCSQAFARLTTNDALIGPATAGGDYLMGWRTLELSVFENIAWTTSSAREQTLQRICSPRLSYDLLEELTDLDQVESLPPIEMELHRIASPRSGKQIAFLRKTLEPWLAEARRQ